MSTYQTPYRSAAALFEAADLMHVGGNGLRALAKSLEAWLEKRRLAIRAMHDFAKMSERDLKDIGLTRVDVNRVAWGASNRYLHPM